MCRCLTERRGTSSTKSLSRILAVLGKLGNLCVSVRLLVDSRDPHSQRNENVLLAATEQRRYQRCTLVVRLSPSPSTSRPPFNLGMIHYCCISSFHEPIIRLLIRTLIPWPVEHTRKLSKLFVRESEKSPQSVCFANHFSFFFSTVAPPPPPSPGKFVCRLIKQGPEKRLRSQAV